MSPCRPSIVSTSAKRSSTPDEDEKNGDATGSRPRKKKGKVMVTRFKGLG